MRPKGKLLALIAMFAAIGLITATGAFTTVEAQRTADVQTAGDANALLALEPAENSEFAETANGEVQISLDSSSTSNDPGGVNTNATTMDDNVLEITNNGQETVEVDIDVDTANGAQIVFYNATAETLNGDGDTLADMPNHPSNGLASERRIINSANSTIELGSGDTATLGLYIETHGVGQSDEVFGSNDITITATDVDEA